MRKRIALISEHASPLAILGGVDNGGQNVYVAQVAQNLAELGCDVDVFTRKDDPDLPEIFEWEKGIRIIHVPAGPPHAIRKEDLLPFMPAFTDYMVLFMGYQTRPYDVIHANFWMSGLVAADLKKKLNIPFVITFHALGRVRRLYQNGDDGFPDERFDIEDRIVAEADRIIAECPQDEADLTGLYHADPAKIVTIPCGFDPDELWPIDRVAARRRLKLPLNGHLILQLGRMVPRKGVDNAIRGLARLLFDHKIPAKLMIVGGDSDRPDPETSPELARLLDIARQEGVEESVLFMGRKPRQVLRFYYSAADIFISTPWYEPFGITPVESMACGTPVIGSNVGGIKYSIADGETGFLVPPENPTALADKMAELLNNKPRMEQFRKQAIRRANDEFTWHKITRQIYSVYEELIAVIREPGPVEISQVALIEQAFYNAQDTLQKSREVITEALLQTAHTMIDALNRGNKIMVCGNGGSAADAIHFSSELVGRFKAVDRVGLPVLALTTDMAAITAWANDVGYEYIFARQVQAFAQPGDVLLAISTTGRSKNLVEAFTQASKSGVTCASLLGMDGGDLLPLSHVSIVVPSNDKQRIQEVQILILHVLSELVEEWLVQAPLLQKPVVAQNGWRYRHSPSIPVTYTPNKT